MAATQKQIHRRSRSHAESEQRWKRRAAKFDKQLPATRNLIKNAEKEILARSREINREIRKLISEQRRNDVLFKAWLSR